LDWQIRFGMLLTYSVSLFILQLLGYEIISHFYRS
jgi:hypothetical protein